MTKTIRTIQTRSVVSRLPKHKAVLLSLGLRRIGHAMEREGTPTIRDMINAVSFMAEVGE